MTTEEKRRAWSKRWREENREGYNAYHREYYARHKQQGLRNPKREATKRWQENNYEKSLEYQRQYYKENAEKIKEYQRQYRKNNPEKMRAYGKKYRDKRRAAKIEAGGTANE